MVVTQPSATEIDRVIKAAFTEDLGITGDITANAIFDPDDMLAASVVARDEGVICGVEIARRVFALHDAAITFEAHLADGDAVGTGDTIAMIRGPARSVLAVERTALNLMGRLSGIASLTRRFVDAVAASDAVITDTRKTTPGLRSLEKFAVRCGGGSNHRMGLFDAVLVKDNHIAAAGSLSAAVKAIRDRVGHMVRIEVEVDTMVQLAELLEHVATVDAVLLDNMTPSVLAEAVALVAGRLVSEASGGVGLDTVAAIAATGVDVISVGAVTHSATNFDIGLDIA